MPIDFSSTQNSDCANSESLQSFAQMKRAEPIGCCVELPAQEATSLYLPVARIKLSSRLIGAASSNALL